ncbi:BTAD domain-containing putative transcriptional regulator [Streptomyces sp. NPDC050704]|uniref:BTAD domain-containing putative transcriptional regulator n=1 Tax=Streptomyces sp. NPDC050704 TaxID=3157219 RepID=UPI003448A142
MAARRPVPRRPRPIWRCTGLLRRTGLVLRGLVAAIALATLLAGVPWGLMRYIGWPLPDHIPTWPDIGATLLAPMSVHFLLNALACVLWPIWGLFALDVVRAAAAEIRAFPRSAPPHTGPLQAAATVLVGAIIVSLLSMRPTAPPPAGPPAAAASVIQPATVGRSGPAQEATVLTTVNELGADVAERGPQRPAETVEVRAPRDGIHDSLWRIAERTLGDGSRWPQIYALNRGRPQPDGHALTNPNLIHPGWVLSLPTRPPHVGPPRHQDQPPSSATPSPSASSGTGTPTTPSTPAPSDTTTPPRTPGAPSHGSHTHAPRNGSNLGISLPTSAFVSAGLAALVAGIVITARRRRRLRYRPGSGDRSDLATAPVVRALLLARDQADIPEDDDDSANAERTTSSNASSAPSTAAASRTLSAEERVIGVKDGQELAWDLARTRGLGLVGPGAYGAIRALLVALLAEHHQPAARHVELLVPATDARQLLGENLADARNSDRLRIVADLDAALDTLERELLSRARLAPDHTTVADSASTPRAELVLVATPAVRAERRLQAILDNGSALGLAGVLLGQWRPGGTARVRQDGTVAAASASVADRLSGASLFTLPATDGQALLYLLRDAEPAAQPSASRVRTTTPSVAEPKSPPRSEHSPDTSSPVQKKPRRRLAQPPTGSREPPPDDDSGSTVPSRAERREQARTHPNPRERLSPTTTPATRASGTSSASRGSDDRTPDDLRKPRHSDTPAAAHPGNSDACLSGWHAHTAAEPLRLTVLGRMHLTHHQHDGDEHADLSAALAPKQREVLAYLAVHQDGARRESLTTAIWPEAPKDRPYNSFHATLSQLRRALRTATHDALSDITIHADGHYALDRNLITVDLWQLRDALQASRHGSDDERRRAAVERAVELYSGDLAADLSAEWLEGPREALRRDVLDAVSALVRILRGEPEQALALLERARTLDPYNEAIYRDIARFQAHLGQHDAVARTFTLLTTKLAEIDEQPSPETTALYAPLQHPQSTDQGRSGRRAR